MGKEITIDLSKIKSAISWNTINFFKNALNKSEQTEQESALHPASQYKPFNPDDLYQKANDYGYYEDMLIDDQVSVALQLKKDMVIGGGWDIIIKDEDQEDIKTELEIALRDIPVRPFDEMLEEILTAYEFGFSLTEKIFTITDRNLMALKELKTRHPSTWTIHQDRKGIVTKYEQWVASGLLDIDPDVLIHYINRPRFQNPYGTSDLRAAWPAYFAKKHVMRYYAIYLEKAASPTPIARYDSNASEDAVNKIFNAIKKLQTRTAMTIPKEIELEYLESKSNGEAYIKGINIFNMMIGRSLLIPDLLGFQGSETTGGSKALGEKQMDVFFKHIERRQKSLEDIINKQIIEPITIYNWGKMENMPKFKFRPLQEENAIEAARVFIEATKGRVYRPTSEEINHFRSLIKFPESDDVEIPGDETDEIDEPNETPVIEDKQKEIEDEQTVEEQEKQEFIYKPTEDIYHQRVDFKALEKNLIKNEKDFMAEAKPVIDKIYNTLIGKLQKKKNITENTSVNVTGVGELNTVIQKHLKDGYLNGKRSANRDLDKSTFAEPILDEKFLSILEKETFEAIGNWKFDIEKDAKIAMRAALKDGLPISSVIELMDDSKKKAVISTNRYARTKFTEVMNKGRMAFFESTGVVSGYQYSAIMDGVTTAICQGLHGKFFKSGTQPIPPMHFNALVEGSLIKTKNGNKLIEQIKIGDEVLTHNNRYCAVYDTMKKFEDKEYFQIELENGKLINITGEHPVYTNRGWIRADELNLKDNVICFEDIVND